LDQMAQLQSYILEVQSLRVTLYSSTK
jgi:hypothetical protein